MMDGELIVKEAGNSLDTPYLLSVDDVLTAALVLCAGSWGSSHLILPVAPRRCIRLVSNHSPLPTLDGARHNVQDSYDVAGLRRRALHGEAEAGDAPLRDDQASA